MSDVKLTEEIKNILHSEYPEMVENLKAQPQASKEVKRFVTYVVTKRGCFGHLIFTSLQAFKTHTKGVYWQEVL